MATTVFRPTVFSFFHRPIVAILAGRAPADGPRDRRGAGAFAVGVPAICDLPNRRRRAGAQPAFVRKNKPLRGFLAPPSDDGRRRRGGGPRARIRFAARYSQRRPRQPTYFASNPAQSAATVCRAAAAKMARGLQLPTARARAARTRCGGVPTKGSAFGRSRRLRDVEAGEPRGGFAQNRGRCDSKIAKGYDRFVGSCELRARTRIASIARHGRCG